MRTFLLLGSAALALSSMPAIAQDMATQPTDPTMSTPSTGPSSPNPTPTDQTTSPRNQMPQDGISGTGTATNDPTMPGSGTTGTMSTGNMGVADQSGSAMKQYPMCSRTVQDSCMNPGESRRSERTRRRR